MIRIPNGPLGAETIIIRNWVLGTLPIGIRERLMDVDFFVGTDPIWVGLHNSIDTSDNRSYREIAHFLGVCHQQELPASRRRPTVVIPSLQGIDYWTIRHELGHALHEVLGWEWNADPITEYAKNNHFEAFAEAFCAWDWPEYANQDMRSFDPETYAYFNNL